MVRYHLEEHDFELVLHDQASPIDTWNDEYVQMLLDLTDRSNWGPHGDSTPLPLDQGPAEGIWE